MQLAGWRAWTGLLLYRCEAVKGLTAEERRWSAVGDSTEGMQIVQDL